MKTRNFLTLAGAILLCSTLAFAQDHNFVGKWKSQDRAKTRHDLLIEFKDDGSLVVEKYQTWGDGLINCEGKGTYSVGNGKLAFDFELFNSDRKSGKKCGTSSRVGSQTYEFIGADQFELTGTDDADGSALFRSFFKGGQKADKEDYYRVFNRVK